MAQKVVTARTASAWSFCYSKLRGGPWHYHKNRLPKGPKEPTRKTLRLPQEKLRCCAGQPWFNTHRCSPTFPKRNAEKSFLVRANANTGDTRQSSWRAIQPET